MTENQRIILGDAISTVDSFTETFRIKDKRDREHEQLELLNRIKDDIRTVLRLERAA